MSAWAKMPPYTGTIHQGCLCCPPVEPSAPMDMVVAVGFGYAGVTRDGEDVWHEDNNSEDFRTLAEFEAMAKADPDHDWRVILEAPLRSREYQRHGDSQWTLIKSGMGFA